MLKLKKNEFITLVKEKAQEKMLSNERRERLQGRLENQVIDTIKDLLPNIVEYNLTAKNNIKSDYVNLNIKVKNLYLFSHNTSSIQVNPSSNYIIILIIKATASKVLKIKTADIIGERLTLQKIKELEEQGKTKEHKKLAEALNL